MLHELKRLHRVATWITVIIGLTAATTHCKKSVSSGALPKLSINGLENVYLGALGPNEVHEHLFRIANIGKGTLKLSRIDVETDSSDLTVDWNPRLGDAPLELGGEEVVIIEFEITKTHEDAAEFTLHLATNDSTHKTVSVVFHISEHLCGGSGLNNCGECGPTPIEVCDSIDNDCDGDVDEGVSTIYYRDGDGDGVGTASETTAACSIPTGFSDRTGDCNDAAGAISPDATEECDDVDNDCNGSIDEGCDCEAGTTRPCGVSDIGACSRGTQTCDGGIWSQVCTGATLPIPETCDGIDNNCNDDVDDGVLNSCGGCGLCLQDMVPIRHYQGISSDIVSGGGRLYVTYGRSVVVFDVIGTTATWVARLPFRGMIKDLELMPQVSLLVAAQGLSGTDSVDTTTVELESPAKNNLVGGGIFSDSLTHSDTRLFVGEGSGAGSITAIDFETGTPEYETLALGIFPWHMDYFGSHLYFLGSGRLVVADVSTPGTLTELYRQADGPYAQGLFAVDGFAFTAGRIHGLVHVFDVTEPASGALVAEADVYSAPYSFAQLGDNLMVGTNVGLANIDIYQPAEPVDGESQHVAGEGRGITVLDGEVWLGAGSGLYHITTDSGRPIGAAVQYRSHSVSRIQVVGNAAYMASTYSTTLLQMDLNAGSGPENVGAEDIDAEGRIGDFEVVDNFAYISFRDLYTPAGIGVLNLQTGVFTPQPGDLKWAFEIDVEGDRVYTAGGPDGVVVFPIESPGVLGAQQVISMPVGSNDVIVRGDFAYVADPGSLVVANISDLTQVQQIELPTETYNDLIAISEQYAVLIGGRGVTIVNIEQPSQPQILFDNDLDAVSSLDGVLINGDSVLIADRDRGIWLLDITDPTDPILDIYHVTAGRPHWFTMVADRLYVADGENGLEVFAMPGDF